MTEELARTKWCPMVREQSEDGPYNRFNGQASSYSLCIASACMMWIETTAGCSIAEGAYKDIPYEGYCGLAGKL